MDCIIVYKSTSFKNIPKAAYIMSKVAAKEEDEHWQRNITSLEIKGSHLPQLAGGYYPFDPLCSPVIVQVL